MKLTDESDTNTDPVPLHKTLLLLLSDSMLPQHQIWIGDIDFKHILQALLRLPSTEGDLLVLRLLESSLQLGKPDYFLSINRDYYSYCLDKGSPTCCKIAAICTKHSVLCQQWFGERLPEIAGNNQLGKYLPIVDAFLQHSVRIASLGSPGKLPLDAFSKRFVIALLKHVAGRNVIDNHLFGDSEEVEGKDLLDEHALTTLQSLYSLGIVDVGLVRSLFYDHQTLWSESQFNFARCFADLCEELIPAFSFKVLSDLRTMFHQSGPTSLEVSFLAVLRIDSPYFESLKAIDRRDDIHKFVEACILQRLDDWRVMDVAGDMVMAVLTDEYDQGPLHSYFLQLTGDKRLIPLLIPRVNATEKIGT